MDNEDPRLDFQLQCLGLLISIWAQITDPWNIVYTLFPIVFMLVVGLILMMCKPKERKYNFMVFINGLSCLIPGIALFYIGLNDDFDGPYRFCHGAWHVLVACSMFYLFQAKCKDVDVMSMTDVLKRDWRHDNSLLLGKQEVSLTVMNKGNLQFLPM